MNTNIKKTTFCLTLLLLLCSRLSFSQKIGIDDLRSFNTMDYSTFKTTIKENFKYSYYDKTESDEFVVYDFDSPDYDHKISKFIYTDTTNNRIEFTIKDKKEFLDFKAEVIKLKYKKIKSGNIYRGVYTDYKMGKLEIRLIEPLAGSSNEPFTMILFR